MPHTRRVLPRMDDVVDDLIHTNAVFHLCKNKRTIAAHPFRVVLHHLQIRAHARGQLSLVNDK